MSKHLKRRSVSRLGLALLASVAMTSPVIVWAQSADQRALVIQPQPLGPALKSLALQADIQLLYAETDVRGKVSASVVQAGSVDAALAALLKGTGLEYVAKGDKTFVVRPIDPTRSELVPASAAGKAIASQAEDIVVTAQKRDEKIKDVPASLTALSGDDLVKLGAQDIDHYATYVPSLVVQNTRPGLAQLTLRGITTGSAQLGSTVGTYIDDVPTGSSSSFAAGSILIPDIDTFDIQRIEILRGPQGTLYGASTMGGLLKYVTTPPDLENVEGRTEFDLGGFDGGGVSYGGKAMINVPLVTDKLALRVEVYDRHSGGFIDDVGTGNKNENTSDVKGGRASLLLKPTDDLTIRFSTLDQDTHDYGTPAIDIDPKTKQPIYGDLEQSREFREKFEEQYQLHNVTANWDLHWADLTSSTSYGATVGHFVQDVTSIYGADFPLFGGILGLPVPNSAPVALLPKRYDLEKITQEMRLASPQNHHLEWQVGAFYTYEWANQRESLHGSTVSGAPQPAALEDVFDDQQPSRFREYAGFGNVDYYLTDRIDLGLGARWSRNRQSFREIEDGLFVGNPSTSNPLQAKAAGSAASDWTYSINPRWRITDDITAYGAVTSGYEPGGPNDTPAGILAPAGSVPNSFGAASLWNYEAGVKTQLLDKHLSINLSVFQIDWSNIQIESAANGFNFVGNGGAARSRGGEFEAQYNPLGGLVLGLNGAFTEATLRDDAPSVGGVKGAPLPTVPKWSGAFTSDYAFPAFGDWDGTVGASYRYVGARNSSFDGSAGMPNVRMDAYELIDLRTSLQSDRWNFTLFVKNLFDKRGVTNIDTTFVTKGSPAYETITDPRTVGLQMTTQF